MFLLICLASCERNAAERDDPSSREQALQLFDAPVIHQLALTLDRSSLAELAREPKDWVRGTLSVEGESYPEVAVRFKGHRSLRSWAEKPAFKLAFDKGKHKGRRILGMQAITLNNMVEDPSMLREQLGALVFAALGVPAPRAAYAELTINGERFGLYTLLEPVDESLLARHFGDGSGPVYEGEYGCDVYENDVWGFEHDGGDDVERKLLGELARGVSGSPGGWFLGEAALVDRERVLAYLAASTLLADFDGYRHGHNYRIYRDPGSARWSFIPWGFDRILKKDFTIFDSQGRVARGCFDDAACRLAYVKTLHAAVSRMEALDLPAQIERLERLIAPAVERDPRRPYSRTERSDAASKLAQFVAERPARLRAQLGCWDGSREVDADGDGHGCMDCNDADAAVHPGAEERCDGVDNDCSGHVDDAASCGCASQQVGEVSYALCDFPMSFWEAEQFCHSLGQSLARVDDKPALKALQVATQAKRKGEWWVGLTDQAREGSYLWPDQSRPARGLWARGEPDHHVCGQHCAAIQPGRKSGLRDMHCATAVPFVCSSVP
jgi:hypothetical protein